VAGGEKSILKFGGSLNRYLNLLILATSSVSSAGINPEITTFLRSFPEKMSCDGVAVNHITQTRKPLTQKITIEFKNKLSDVPMIEVKAPSSERGQFRIGDGYGGSMEKSGHYSYEFLSDQNNKALLYIRRLPGDNSDFDTQMYLRIRDAGRMISMSENRICRTTYHCIEFSNCTAIP